LFYFFFATFPAFSVCFFLKIFLLYFLFFLSPPLMQGRTHGGVTGAAAQGSGI
jgi:hypothetical protein